MSIIKTKKYNFYYWFKRNKRLKSFEYVFMTELIDGKKTLTELNIKLVRYNLAKVKKFGFINE